MNKIRILLLEENRMLRSSIEVMLKKHPDISVVGTVSNSENMLEMAAKLKPNILLINLKLTNQNSLHLVKVVKKQINKVEIVLMGLEPEQSTLHKFIQAGVSGFILKDANADRFIKTMQKVSQGMKVLPPPLTGSLFSQIVDGLISESNSDIEKKSVRMTKREREVTALIAEGYTNKEIAQELELSTYTVKSHVHNILEKLTFSTRVQIAKHYHQNDAVKSALDTTSLLDE